MGCDPGYARSNSETLEFGSSLLEVAASEKSFRAVLSSACISIPTVNSQSSRGRFSSDEGLEIPALVSKRFFFASSFSCFRSGTTGVVLSAVCVVRHRWIVSDWTILWPWINGRGRVIHRVENRAPLDSINHERQLVYLEVDV